MKTIGATEFKQKCLAILDRIGPDGVVITKHGKPVARLLPVDGEPARWIGRFAGKIHIKGDIESTGVPWNAQS